MIAAEVGHTAILVPSMSDAYLGRANRIVHGYVTKRGGGLRFEIAIEDASRHKLTDPVAYSGQMISAMTAAAKSIDPAARGFSTGHEEAVEAWGIASSRKR